MLVQILVCVIIVIGFVCFLASRRPNNFRYERSNTINASPSTIFPHVNNLRKWEDWSPWAKIDPNCTTTYEGPAEGIGAITKWEGNAKVGKGIMTILESNPNELIKIKLEFLKPMKGISTAEFTFKPEGGATNVIWSMYGENGFAGKLMSLVMNCDDMMAKQFDKGLAQLKTVSEAGK